MGYEVKLSVGEVVKFVYNGKVREVRLEVVKPTLITGFDYRADGMRGAYRSFKIENIRALAVC